MKLYPLAVIYLSNSALAFLAIILMAANVAHAGGIDLSQPAAPAPTPTKPIAKLLPYTATYTSTVKGVNAEMERTLKKVEAGQWELRNFVSVLFVTIEEKATFSESNAQLTPGTYRYTNSLNKKRNSTLVFDTEQDTVFDHLHSETPLVLPANSFDKLSFQPQLRLNLIAQGKDFNRTTFHLVDRHRYKSYDVEVLAKEQVTTKAGTFNAIKIKQQRPNKANYTLIWLATDWDYFVVRIERINEDEEDYRVDLKNATLNGEPLRGL